MAKVLDRPGGAPAPFEVRPKNRVLGRRSYQKIPTSLELPNLIDIQVESFKWFKREGLRDLFSRVFPIRGYSDNYELLFLEHYLEEPPFSVEECKRKDFTYQAPLKLRLRLIKRLTGEEIESDVFLGDLPLMTDNGTFVINGAER
ncbi:MAG TPA: DNA-directed RNA polymerase subunit beta, partial [bacterium]|nr:DNA-directed RNA polymerase subunit beta [bacterium]